MLQIHFALREKQRCLLCVDGKDASDFQGRLYHMLLMEPKGIVGIGQFLLEMEEIFKRAGRPAASTQNRVLSGKSKNSGRPEKKEEENGPVEKNNELIEPGKKATFLIQVQYRQNATWQGEITWVEKKESIQFRSALELIKLIDSAVQESEI